MDHESGFDDRGRETGTSNPSFEPVTVGKGRERVRLELTRQGRDYLLVVTGGRAHVGAVAVWSALSGGGPAAVTQLPGHREGPLAGECAEILGRACGRTVAAVAGIHQDDVSPREIAAIVANARKGAVQLAQMLGGVGPGSERDNR